ncbi:uncharacterized protein [Rutidosis leptorrhynchoides]|uniref:uncharacterized protein n=1 Tax=Rutidosis leptorrhynchoides TaxID=125765 RepID=UPI003A99BE8A
MASQYDKIYTVTSIYHLIPVKLDLFKLNYSNWKKIFTTHYAGFDVLKYIQGTSTVDEQVTSEWLIADAVISTWIYNTISEPLLERVLNNNILQPTKPGSFLKKIQDNKSSKTMELTVELRGLDIGNQSIEEYFRQIDKFVALLKNLGSTVEDRDLVMYAVNGLNGNYHHASYIIIHRHTFPDFDTVRSMILMEEMNDNRLSKQTFDTQSNSSSPSALIAQTTPSHTNNSSQPEICHNFSKGYCRFENRRHFLHQGSPRRHNSTANSYNNSRPMSLNQDQLLQIIVAQQH